MQQRLRTWQQQLLRLLLLMLGCPRGLRLVLQAAAVMFQGVMMETFQRGDLQGRSLTYCC
jgi:hypothetical protein